MFFTVLTWPDLGHNVAHQLRRVYYISKYKGTTYLKRLTSSTPVGGSVVISRTSSCIHWSWLRNWRSLLIHNRDKKISLPSGEMTDKPHLNKLDVDPTNRPPVLCLALLQHILLIHELGKSNILFVQQSLQVGGRV